MTEDLYNTLKVPKNASPEVIKKAFRRRAKRTHPDMGGTAEEFNAVKTAYLILVNDETRKEYDETGTYSQQKVDDVETRARQTVIGLFMKVVQVYGDRIIFVDIFKEMHQQIISTEHDFKNKIEGCKKTIKRWEIIRERLIYKGDKDNFLLPVIEDQIGKANREILNLEKEIKMADIIKDLLKGYAFRSDPNFAPTTQEIRSFSFFENSSTTTYTTT